MQYRRHTSSLACLFILFAAAHGAVAQSDDGSVQFHVKMTTSLTVPKNRNVEQVRVWQALPTRKEWCDEIENVSWAPEGGERQHRVEDDSEHIFFRQTKELTPGKTLEFTSQFSFVSRERNFDSALSKTKWKDIEDPPSNSERNSQIVEFAKILRKARTPSLAVAQACKAINEQMTYDASVSYPTSDVAATLKNKRGHCGHYYRLLKESCDALGIQIRVVRGMNLYVEDGISGRLQAIRPDYTNVHTWAEVFLPKDGWVEVEPSRGKDPFRIPAQFVGNNRWFQNYAIWIREDGKESLHKWRQVNGTYVSDFKVSNTIEFQKSAIGKNTKH